jgi:uncharacterized protein (DUF2141 family)
MKISHIALYTYIRHPVFSTKNQKFGTIDATKTEKHWIFEIPKKIMKTITILSTFFLITLFSMSKDANTTTLTVEFNITKYNKGSIFFALYDSEANYMKSAVYSTKVKVTDKKAIVVVENLAPGNYGFSFFHDVNDNGKLNKNFLGIPKEPYGFSNNEKGTFGPPDFEKISFNVQQDLTLSVSVK